MMHSLRSKVSRWRDARNSRRSTRNASNARSNQGQQAPQSPATPRSPPPAHNEPVVVGHEQIGVRRHEAVTYGGDGNSWLWLFVFAGAASNVGSFDGRSPSAAPEISRYESRTGIECSHAEPTPIVIVLCCSGDDSKRERRADYGDSQLRPTCSPFDGARRRSFLTTILPIQTTREDIVRPHQLTLFFVHILSRFHDC